MYDGKFISYTLLYFCIIMKNTFCARLQLNIHAVIFKMKMPMSWVRSLEEPVCFLEISRSDDLWFWKVKLNPKISTTKKKFQLLLLLNKYHFYYFWYKYDYYYYCDTGHYIILKQCHKHWNDMIFLLFNNM